MYIGNENKNNKHKKSMDNYCRPCKSIKSKRN